MARIKYSALVDQINGSIGGTTFQNNRYGYTIKRKPSGTKTGTPSQKNRRFALYQVQQAWIALSDVQRAAWNTYASTFPTPTRLNPTSFLNGVNLYERYNLLRITAGETQLSNPSGAQETLSFGGLNLERSGSTLFLTSAVSLSGSNWFAMFFLSRPLRSTTQDSKSKTRFTYVDFTSGDTEEFIEAEYEALFGVLPAIGEFVQIRRVYLNSTNGQIYDSGVSTLEIT